jgi:RimJ/RimL family protein N-acetyltransferase
MSQDRSEMSQARGALIETERLVLRPISLEDLDDLVALSSDPEVMRYLTGGFPTPRAEIEQVVRKRAATRWSGFERETGHFVGWYDTTATGEGEYELGYRLVRRAWGRGLATEGARALVDRAFGELGAERIWAQTMAVNSRSRAVMKRCGLSYVRTFHLAWDDPIEGTDEGEVEYELLRADWERRRIPPP